MLQFVLLDLGENLPVGTTSLLHQLTKEQIPFCFFPTNPTTDYPITDTQLFKTQIDYSKKINMIEEQYDSTFLTEQKLQQLILLSNNQQLQPNNCLLITVCPTLALAAKNEGFVSFGYCDARNSVRFPGIPLVLEGLEDIELSFLKREFSHALHEPAYICETNRCDIKELPLADIPTLYEMLQQEGSIPNISTISEMLHQESVSTQFTNVHTTTAQKEAIPFLLEPLGTLSEELEKHEAYIRYVYPFSYYGVWGIYEKESEHLIGRIGITELMLHNHPEYVLEYFIHTSYRRCGYASECVNAILHYAKELETDTICVCIHKQNTASLNVLSHCIFPYEEIQAEQVGIRCFRIYLNAEQAIPHSNA